MTQNQIAHAQQLEDARHNQVYEEETNRHNKATEDIQTEANNITATHNSESRRLNEDYNNKYIEYLYASKEDKYELDKELNNIKQAIANNDAWYDREMAGLQERRDQADANYKGALATIGYMDAETRKLQAYYEGQKTEADIQFQRGSLELRRDELNAQIEKIRNDYNARVTEINNAYTLGMINAETRSAELRLAKDKFEEEKDRWSTTYQTNVQAGTELTKQQTKTEKAKKAESVSKTVKNYADIGVSAVDAVMPF